MLFYKQEVHKISKKVVENLQGVGGGVLKVKCFSFNQESF